MIDFTDLKQVIKNSCKTRETGEDFNNHFKFYINFEKLERILTQKKSDLHVIVPVSRDESWIPSIDEIQNISEYIKTDTDAKHIFDGKSEIFEFILFSTKNDELSTEELGAEEDTKHIKDAITNLVMNFPVYRTLIVRRFDTRKDKFEYVIYFRSNYNMISYIKELNSSEDHID